MNLVCVFIVNKAFAPLLGLYRALRGNPGRIINIRSVGGKNANPFMGAYAASKHALEGFSESLRRELMVYGIDVIIVGPGSVATPIWDKAEQADIAPYIDTDYAEALDRMRKIMLQSGRNGYPPEKVGEVVWRALTIPKPRIRYPVISLRSFRRIIQMILPKRMVDQIIARNLGFIK